MILRRDGIVPLQHADDIFFSSAEVSHLVNLKRILLWCKEISGMRVCFHKSEFITSFQ